MTPIECVQEVCASYGRPVDADTADFLLWNYTGYPQFWPRGMTPEQGIRHQIATHLVGLPVPNEFLEMGTYVDRGPNWEPLGLLDTLISNVLERYSE